MEEEQKRQKQKQMLLEEGERQKEYKMQLMLQNIEEERKHFERQLAEKKAEDEKLRHQQELQMQSRLHNKDFVVHQIGQTKHKSKEERTNKLNEEKKVIQEQVVDLNEKFSSMKGEVLSEMKDKTFSSRKIIERIGKKTSLF